MDWHFQLPTGWQVFGLALLGLLGVLALRILIPVLWSIAVRARQHGPAPVGSPNSGGRWLGWVASATWSVFEAKREESFEHSHETTRMGSVLRGRRIAPLPMSAPPGSPEQVEDPSAPEFQELNLDASRWWNGREWLDSQRFVPPSAPRSVDGSHWWDGQVWRWLPNEFPLRDSHLPQRVNALPVAGGSQVAAPSRYASERSGASPNDTASESLGSSQSWLVRRHGHTGDRQVAMDRPALRSDPPPVHLRAEAQPKLKHASRRPWRG